MGFNPERRTVVLVTSRFFFFVTIIVEDAFMLEQTGSFQCCHCCSSQWQRTGAQRVPLNRDVLSPGGVNINCNYGPALADGKYGHAG